MIATSRAIEPGAYNPPNPSWRCRKGRGLDRTSFIRCSDRAAWARSIAPSTSGSRRDVAIKLISERRSAETDAVDRFIREALAVSALNHPNIVTIHETGESESGRFIAMEFVQGRSLREPMRRGPDARRAPSTSPARSPRRWPSRTPRRSCTATSSQTT